MGLPDFLFDSRKRYKADTGRVATWLAETAQKCRYTLATQSTASPAAPSTSTGNGRLKGKARTQNKTTRSPGRYAVSTQELLAMAEVITAQNPPIKTPTIVITLLRSAIALRKRCTQWFSVKANSSDEVASNATHSHFTTVLEKILGLLQPTGPGGNPEQTSSAQTTDTQVDTLNNIFDVLDIEESEISQIAPSSAVSGNKTITTKAPSQTLYELETDDGEIYFALFCFFDDLNRLREYLKHMWEDYNNGYENLVTVSVITNMAFQLVKQAEQEVITTFPTLKSYTEISGVLYAVMCHLRGEDPTYIPVGKLSNPVMLEVADWLFMPVASSLDSFCNVIEENHAPIYKPGYLGVYDPKADRSKQTLEERIGDDRIILMELLPEFVIASKIGSHYLPVPDELTNGLFSMFSTKKAPLWVVYSCQVFLDITHTLRSDVSRGLSDLRGTGVRASISLKQYFGSKGMRIFANWPPSNEHGVERFGEFIKQWAIGDAFAFAKRKMLRGSPLEPQPESFAFLSRNPLLCGLIQFKLYTEMKELGTALAGAWGSILYVAHLYNACLQGKYLKEGEKWPDMEMVMDFHSRESMFAGQVPETPDQWMKSMTLMLGAAPETFARATRISQLKMSKKGPKMMSFESPISDVFRQEYFDTGDAALTLDTIQKLLDEGKTPRTSDAVVAHPGKSTSLLHKQWAKSHKLTPIQLLGTLRDAIATEEPMLRFDYVSFHLRCLKLLRSVRDVADAKLTQYFGRDYIENDSQLPFVVHYIFQVARGAHALGEKSRLHENVRSAMMVKVADVFREFIQREGRAESDKVAKICVNWSETGRVREIME